MVRICSRCHRSYPADAEYCNDCNLDLPQERTLSRFRQHGESRGMRWLASVAGLGAAFVMMLTALAFVFGGGFDALRTGGSLGGVLYAVYAWAERRCRMARLRSGEELAHHDTRPPVLFLRAFERDGAMMATDRMIDFTRLVFPFARRGDLETFEERLADALFILGPPLAICKPGAGNDSAHMGAARIAGNDEWQAKVATLIRQARYIVLMLDKSAGVRWEIEQVFEARDRARLFIVPPVQGFWRRRSFRKDYAVLLRQFPALPAFDPRLVAVLYAPGAGKGEVFFGTRKYPAPRQRLVAIESAIHKLHERDVPRVPGAVLPGGHPRTHARPVVAQGRDPESA